MDRRSFLTAGTALLWFHLAGCENEPGQLVPVRGSVRYRSLLLRQGVIVFTPDAVRGGGGPISHAEIQPDGSYVLACDDGPGAVPGWHRVTITAYGGVDSRSLLPTRYGDPEQSGLAFEIKPDRNNVIEIDLE
ncbi:MAG TPA: hypothetical protein VKE94_21280 [Gemmataceae bacterium]|nr:hypothetical protein [Gemmataceae bacterium]